MTHWKMMKDMIRITSTLIITPMNHLITRRIKVSSSNVINIDEQAEDDHYQYDQQQGTFLPGNCLEPCTQEETKEPPNDSDEEIKEERKDSDEMVNQEMLNRRERVNYGRDANRKDMANPSDLSLHDEENDKHQVTVDDDYKGDPSSFEVIDPIVGSHVTYTVKGYDDEGPFEGTRRYNDFFKLRNTLLSRIPGIYIPPIPPKKALGNKNDKFLEERKYFLQRFLQLTCRISYLIKSEEFKWFARPSGEIDKGLDALPKITPELLLERLTQEYEFTEEDDDREITENQSLINSYSVFIKNIAPVLKTMRDKVKPMILERDTENSNFKDMITMMSHYEEGALLQYADGNANKLVVGNSLNPLYIETAEDIVDKLKNPYKEYYYWVKGEIYDIQALLDCLEGLNRLRKQKEKLESKKKSDDQTLEKLKSGKKTLKTIFTGEAKKEQLVTTMTNDLDVIDRDIGRTIKLYFQI